MQPTHYHANQFPFELFCVLEKSQSIDFVSGLSSISNFYCTRKDNQFVHNILSLNTSKHATHQIKTCHLMTSFHLATRMFTCFVDNNMSGYMKFI